MSEADRRYIAVDKTRVVRCKWCGGTESSNWIIEPGGPWCSWDCEQAQKREWGIPAEPFIVCCSLLVLASLFLIFLQRPEPLVFLVTILFVSFLCFFTIVWFWEIRGSEDAKKRVPRDSRRLDRVFNHKLFACGYCAGALEVTTGATTAECSYCGLTNEIARH
ncbi:MAG: hypothetical protein ACXADO_08605 [Candidatus Thorarchaeota archaeon]